MKKKNVKDIDMDDIREGVGEQLTGFLNERCEILMNHIQKTESTEDYWFAKYYEAACFSLFTIGIMINIQGIHLWLKPDTVLTAEQEEGLQNCLKGAVNEDMWSIFAGREKLAIRIFSFGTHYFHTHPEEFISLDAGESDEGNS